MGDCVVGKLMSINKNLGENGLRKNWAQRTRMSGLRKGMSEKNKKTGKWLRGRDG